MDFKVLKKIDIKTNNKYNRFIINFKKFYKNAINKYGIFFLKKIPFNFK